MFHIQLEKFQDSYFPKSHDFILPLTLKHISDNLALILAIIIGVGVYFILIYFMGIEEVDSMIDAIKNKLKRSVSNE